MRIGLIVAGIAGLILVFLFAPMVPSLWNGGRVIEEGDARFIEQMIPHHQDAISMAGLALIRAEHAEINTLAKNILKSQTEEIKAMQQWYRSWFGREVPGQAASIGHSGEMSDLAKLRSAGQFDREFIGQMVPHHQQAVMMAKMLGRSTKRPEMKKLAADIILAQSKEIAQMRAWFSSWYGGK